MYGPQTIVTRRKARPRPKKQEVKHEANGPLINDQSVMNDKSLGLVSSQPASPGLNDVTTSVAQGKITRPFPKQS